VDSTCDTGPFDFIAASLRGTSYCTQDDSNKKLLVKKVCKEILGEENEITFAILAIIALTFVAATIIPSRRASAADNAAPPVTIKIDNFSFAPQTIVIPAGTEVTWTNQDDIPHTVVSDDKTTFKSRALDTDENSVSRSRTKEPTCISVPFIQK